MEVRSDIRTTGLHHITAICSDPKENVRFYTEALNLRFIKKTVNQDDPGSYHLYYSDEEGTPGTLMTFFTWHLPRGESGAGEVSSITFAVEDVNDWTYHLREKAVPFEREDDTLVFSDPEGIELRIVESPMPGREPMGRPGMLGVQGVELTVEDPDRTIPLLEAMGFTRDGSDRFVHKDSNTFVTFATAQTQALQGAGSVHHVAFGVEPEDQEHARKVITNMGYSPTPIVERFYFKSVYFRETSGVLFEIATNGPGFFVDEEVPGSSLVLPPWLEAYRERIESALPDL